MRISLALVATYLLIVGLVSGCAPVDEGIQTKVSGATSPGYATKVSGATSPGYAPPDCRDRSWNRQECDLVVVAPFRGQRVPGLYRRAIDCPGDEHEALGWSPEPVERGRIGAAWYAASTARISALDLQATWRQACPRGPNACPCGGDDCGVLIQYRDGSGDYPTAAVNVVLWGGLDMPDTQMPLVRIGYYFHELVPFDQWHQSWDGTLLPYAVHWMAETPRARQTAWTYDDGRDPFHRIPLFSAPAPSGALFRDAYPGWRATFWP